MIGNCAPKASRSQKQNCAASFRESPMEVSGITQYLGLYQKPLWRGDHKHDYSQIRVPVLAFLCLRSWDILNFPKTRYGKTI